MWLVSAPTCQSLHISLPQQILNIRVISFARYFFPKVDLIGNCEGQECREYFRRHQRKAYQNLKLTQLLFKTAIPFVTPPQKAPFSHLVANRSKGYSLRGHHALRSADPSSKGDSSCQHFTPLLGQAVATKLHNQASEHHCLVASWQ